MSYPSTSTSIPQFMDPNPISSGPLMDVEWLEEDTPSPLVLQTESQTTVLPLRHSLQILLAFLFSQTSRQRFRPENLGNLSAPPHQSEGRGHKGKGIIYSMKIIIVRAENKIITTQQEKQLPSHISGSTLLWRQWRLQQLVVTIYSTASMDRQINQGANLEAQ